MRLYLCYLVLICLALKAYSKGTTGKLHVKVMNQKGWDYLAKFAVGPGEQGGQFKTRFQFQKVLAIANNTNVETSFLVYTEEQWNKARALDDCSAKKSLAQLDFPVKIPLDGSWTDYIEANLGKQSETIYWFFALSDCEKNVKIYITGKDLKYEIEFFNSDGSHFGQDENGIMPPLFLATIIIIVFFALNSIKFYKFYKAQESMDYPTMIVAIALFFELSALICELTHLQSFANNGVGYFALDFGNKLLSILAQATISCLLLLIASGWSINMIEIPDRADSVPLIVLLFSSHLLVVGLTVATEGSHYRFHDYESWPGIIIIVMRIVLLFVFIHLLRKTYKISSSDKQKFFKSFGILSAIYFLTFPILVAGSSLLLPTYMRHKVVSGGTLILQTCTLIFFTILFTSKTMQYHKVSFKGRSLLPENKLH